MDHKPEYYTRELQGGGRARRWCVRCSCGWAMRTNDPGPSGKRLVRAYFAKHLADTMAQVQQ